MKLLIDNTQISYDELEVTISINSITRQFTFKDIAHTQKYQTGQKVEIYNDDNVLLVKAEIEYIEALSDENKSEFVYAGRNNARYIVDNYADKTIQFTEKQKLKSVLNEVASKFKLSITGDAKLPTDETKTILIGDRYGKAILEIVKSAGKIITSDADGNLEIQFEATKQDDTLLEYGINIRKRKYKKDTTNIYDSYTIVSQSNYIVSQQQEVDVKGSFGSGDFKKVILSKNTLSTKECEELAEVESKKDKRKAIEYSIVSDMDLELNTKYFIKDDAVGIDEQMNLRDIVLTKTGTKYEKRYYFESVV